MSTPKRGLGRGLEALIPITPKPKPETGVRQVPVGHIEPNPDQPRTKLDPVALAELAESIRAHGLIQPLIVSAMGLVDGVERFQIIAGERRWRAAKLAGLEQVTVIVRGVTPQERLELALVENIQRADLNPLEEAQAFDHLIQDFGLTQEQVATRVGKDRTTVANALRLLKLPDALKAAVANGDITQGHARALLQITDEQVQYSLLLSVITKSLSVRQTEELVRRTLEGTRAKKRKPVELPHETRKVEEDLRQALGTKVSLTHTRNGGKIVISYFSDEELEAIYQKIVKG